MIAVVNNVFAILTIISQIILFVLLLYIFINIDRKEDKMLDFLIKNAIIFSFIIASVATLGSLFYSEIAQYDPCKLCWLQRIFMYPLPIIFLIAYIKNDKLIHRYALPLTIFGALIATYHNYIYYGGRVLASCTASGLGESCSRRFVFLYGYISIPVMALTAFLMIMFLMYNLKRSEKITNLN